MWQRCCKRRWLRLASGPVRLALRLLREPDAVVHINTSLNRRAFWRDLGFLAVARSCGSRIVYQVHGGALPRQFCADNRLPVALLRWILGLADVVVVLADCELAAYREFVPGQPVVRVPNGIDCRAFVVADRPEPAPGSDLRLVYLGRMTREKGLVEALEGLALARWQGTGATLVLGGDGPDEGLLKAVAERLGLGAQVRFAGPVAGEAKRALYRDADALLLPTHAEGLPYTLLEAMAAGLPPITTRVGGIPDVVAADVHGLFVPPGDPAAIAAAIGQLGSERAALARMREACVQRVATGFAIAQVAEAFGGLYRGRLRPVRADVPGPA